MDELDQVELNYQKTYVKTEGCGAMFLFVASAFWIIISAVLSQFISWAIEQAIFEGSLGLPDIRWLVALVYGFTQFIPSLILTLLTKSPGKKEFYRAWLLTSILLFVLFPSRLVGITAFQASTALKIIAMGIFILVIYIWLKRKENIPANREFRGNKHGLGLSLLIGAFLAYPWVLWGALGSPLDSVLGLLLGFLFGITACLILQPVISIINHSDKHDYSFKDFCIEGFLASLILLTLVTGLGQSGNQYVLTLTVPILGWTYVILGRYGKSRTHQINWPIQAIFLGFAATWPLVWIDPDELSMVISTGSGELISWVNRIIFAGLSIGVLIGMLLLAFRRKIERASRCSSIGNVFIIGIWLSVVAVYYLWGQPGFFGERLFVIFNDQTDLSDAVSIEDPLQRRQFVYDTLVSKASSTQEDFQTKLNRFGIQHTYYYLVNGMEIQAGPIVRWWLEKIPEVDRVLDSPVLRPLSSEVPLSIGIESAPNYPDWNLTLIGADRVWELGIGGEGIVIGQSDSGVQGDHPELAGKYRGSNGQDDYNWFDPWYHSMQPYDIGGHGTHTLGSILGEKVGVAPEAKWIGCVNLARNLGNPALYLDCMQFMLAPFPLDGDPFLDGDPSKGAHIINNSWGCPPVEGCDPNTFLYAVRALRSAGMFIVVSAGNSGYSGCGSVDSPPAIYDEVYSVGAVDSLGTLAQFSSLGPVIVDESNRTKPDILAPGDGVLSSFPGSSYEITSGTSMAGPHVVGVVALMWSANRSLIGNVEHTEEILNMTATPYVGSFPVCIDDTDIPNNASGYGVVNALAAVQMAIADNEDD